jgi:ABC-type multidrug transport system fused ATPase/permease subunit
VASVWSAVAVVQEPMLLAGTVAENIAVGVPGGPGPDRGGPAAMGTASIAAPDDTTPRWASARPSGRRQRLATRALLNAPILILDEPTAP